MMKRSAKWVLGTALLGGVGTGAWVLMGSAGSSGAAASADGKNTSRPSVDVYEVANQRFDITTIAAGELAAKNKIEIRSEVENETTIVDIVPEGAFVQPGEVLVKLNAESILLKIDDQTLALKNAQTELTAAEEEYFIQQSENDSTLRSAKSKMEIAELDMQKWLEGEVKIKRLEQQHAIERAEKEVTRLEEVVAKSRELQSAGFYSMDSLKRDERDYEQAQADLAKARLDHDVYEQYEYKKDFKQRETDLANARAELDRVQRQNELRLASKQATLENRRETYAQRERMMAKYQDQLAKSTIVAPSAGLVVYATSMEASRWGNEEALQIGTKVSPNKTLIVLPDTSEMVASVKVHESIAGRVRPGQPAFVKVDAVGGQRIPGKVESIGILAESSGGWRGDPNVREYTVRIALDRDAVMALAGGATNTANPGGNSEREAGAGGGSGRGRGGLKPSMRCDAEIVMGEVSDAIAVPVQAVFNEGMIRYVFVRDGGHWARRPVQMGRRSDRYAEIMAGLKPGERVLLRRAETGEMVAEPWDTDELAAVGLMIDEEGRVAPKRSAEAPGSARPGTAAPAAAARPDSAQIDVGS